jgi:hypothetical protein
MRALPAAVFLAVFTMACDPHYRSWTPTVRPMPRPAPPPPAAATPLPADRAPLAGTAPPRYYSPTPEEIESAAIGPYPENYELLVRHYLHNRLYRPDEARYRFSRQPKKAYRPGYSRQGTLFAWSIGAYVNAKNATGVYTGEDFHLFYVVNGRIVAHSNVDADLRRFTIGSR